MDQETLPYEAVRRGLGNVAAIVAEANLAATDARTAGKASDAQIHAGSFDVNLGGVVRVFPLAQSDGAMHVQAGELLPLEMVRSLPALAGGGSIRGKNFNDSRGVRMEVDAIGDERLRPVIDGEIYERIDKLAVELGRRVRIARV